jgi:hypothetical protein
MIKRYLDSGSTVILKSGYANYGNSVEKPTLLLCTFGNVHLHMTVCINSEQRDKTEVCELMHMTFVTSQLWDLSPPYSNKKYTVLLYYSGIQYCEEKSERLLQVSAAF